MKEKFYYIKAQFSGYDKYGSVIKFTYCWTVKGNMLARGYMTKDARELVEQKGCVYDEESFVIDNIIRLTEEEYEALNDNNEPV